jgi:hypothetical protein
MLSYLVFYIAVSAAKIGWLWIGYCRMILNKISGGMWQKSSALF